MRQLTIILVGIEIGTNTEQSLEIFKNDTDDNVQFQLKYTSPESYEIVDVLSKEVVKEFKDKI